jgi:hypothetical protein
MNWGDKKWRHLYRYVCRFCAKVRFTKSYERLKSEVCTLCEKGQEVSKGQQQLFETTNI